MKDDNLHKFEKMDDESLFSIFQLKRDQYEKSELNLVEEILRKRGYEINYEDQTLSRFSEFTDEELTNIVENGAEDFLESDINIIEGILRKRGYDIEISEEKIEPVNYVPIVIGLLFIALNFYLASMAYNYEITGIGNFVTSYLIEVGIWHDITLRVIIIMIILYYRSKRKKANYILWTIAGLIFGAWALVGAGIPNLFSNTFE